MLLKNVDSGFLDFVCGSSRIMSTLCGLCALAYQPDEGFPVCESVTSMESCRRTCSINGWAVWAHITDCLERFFIVLCSPGLHFVCVSHVNASFRRSYRLWVTELPLTMVEFVRASVLNRMTVVHYGYRHNAVLLSGAWSWSVVLRLWSEKVRLDHNPILSLLHLCRVE